MASLRHGDQVRVSLTIPSREMDGRQLELITFYSLCALRMATDLNLHRKTAVSSQDTQEGKARDIEVHNRERTWILCFCLDRSFSAQMGKPSTVKEE